MNEMTVTQNLGGIYCSSSNFSIEKSSIYNNLYNNDFTYCSGCNYVGIVEPNPCETNCPRDACSVCQGDGSSCQSGCDNGKV